MISLGQHLEFPQAQCRVFYFICSPEGDRKCCGKSRKCSKGKGHVGKCDSKRQVNRYWETSPIFNIHKERQTLQDNFRHLQVQEDALSKKEQDILALQRETDSLVEESG